MITLELQAFIMIQENIRSINNLQAIWSQRKKKENFHLTISCAAIKKATMSDNLCELKLSYLYQLL
jgi:hypothetical protein